MYALRTMIHPKTCERFKQGRIFETDERIGRQFYRQARAKYVEGESVKMTAIKTLVHPASGREVKRGVKFNVPGSVAELLRRTSKAVYAERDKMLRADAVQTKAG